MYRVYIRTFDQKVLDMYHTKSAADARERFAELVNSTEYDGKKIGAALTRNNQQVAFHRFDSEPGHVNYWRGRIDEIEIPNPVGRPAADVLRKNITISPEMWELARAIGQGNASAGISAALAAYDVTEQQNNETNRLLE